MLASGPPPQHRTTPVASTAARGASTPSVRQRSSNGEERIGSPAAKAPRSAPSDRAVIWLHDHIRPDRGHRLADGRRDRQPVHDESLTPNSATISSCSALHRRRGSATCPSPPPAVDTRFRPMTPLPPAANTPITSHSSSGNSLHSRRREQPGPSVTPGRYRTTLEGTAQSGPPPCAVDPRPAGPAWDSASSASSVTSSPGARIRMCQSARTRTSSTTTRPNRFARWPTVSRGAEGRGFRGDI